MKDTVRERFYIEIVISLMCQSSYDSYIFVSAGKFTSYLYVHRGFFQDYL